MRSIATKVVTTVAFAAVLVFVGKAYAQSDSAANKPTSYSPYSSALMYSPYSSMASMYSQYSPMMSSSMMMPYYSSGAYPYGQSMGSYGQASGASSYHPSQYLTMSGSYPPSSYLPLPYMGYSGYSPSYYG